MANPTTRRVYAGSGWLLVSVCATAVGLKFGGGSWALNHAALLNRTIVTSVVGAIAMALAYFASNDSQQDSSSSKPVSQAVGRDNIGKMIGNVERYYEAPENAHPTPLATNDFSAVPSEQDIPTREHHKHNVKFLGASSIYTDMERQTFSATEGFPAVKVCFLNQPIPGAHIADFTNASARIVFQNKAGEEVLSVNHPKWLNRKTQRYVNIKGNIPECILLAVCGNDDQWFSPFIEDHEFHDHGEFRMIGGAPLPLGELTARIYIVGSNNLGLEAETVHFSLDKGGKSEIKQAVRSSEKDIPEATQILDASLIIHDVVMHRTGDCESPYRYGEFLVQVSAQAPSQIVVEYSAQLVFRGTTRELELVDDVGDWEIVEREYYKQLERNILPDRRKFITNPSALTKELTTKRSEGWLHFRVDGMGETDIARRTLRLYANTTYGSIHADRELAQDHVVRSNLVAMRKLRIRQQ